MGKWVVTSAWPYTSDVPHLGNLIGSVLSADVAARFLRLRGHSVIFVSGSDEHGTPVEIEAVKRGVPVKELANRNHQRISELFKKWDISYDNYTRTESPVHVEFTQEHYRRVYEQGYIFEQEEQVHYCPRDDKFLPDRFVEGVCPQCGSLGARGDQCDACGRPLDAVKLVNPYCAICGGPTEVRATKQWFFDLPKLADEIRRYIVENKELSENAVNFSLSWLDEGLKPRSLTRDTGWGIPAPFPGAEGKTIYVWMEAVLGYLSASIEYFAQRGEPEKWKAYWLDPSTKTCFFIGKDNIPFHTIILTGLLLASRQGYTLPGVISSTEFLQFEGKKFSKSRRVGVWIDEALEVLPADYWRYTLLSVRPETGDVSFTYDLLSEKVNSELNDKIGNFVNRTLSAVKRFMGGVVEERPPLSKDGEEFLASTLKRHQEIANAYEAFRLQRAVKMTLQQAEEGNRWLNATEPWRTFPQNPEAGREALYIALRTVKTLAVELQPIIPRSAETMWGFLRTGKGIEEAGWSGAEEDMEYPVEIGEFHPLFSKVDKEEVIRRVEETRGRQESA